MPRRKGPTRRSKNLKNAKETANRSKIQALKLPTTLRIAPGPCIEDRRAVETLKEKGNLILVDSVWRRPILQRLSPTSVKKKRAAGRSATQGCRKFEVIGKDKLHLGIWHGTGTALSMSHLTPGAAMVLGQTCLAGQGTIVISFYFH